MAGDPTFPLIYMSPQDGVLLELPDREKIGERIPEIDTDAIAEQARRWVVDAAGRRVRLKVEFGRVDRCEVLPGRPPMTETLDQMRLETVQARVAKIPGGRGAMAWARAAAVAAAFCSLVGVIVHGVEMTSTGLSAINIALHVAALLFACAGSALLLFGAWRRSGFVLLGLCAIVMGGGALAPARLWALYEYGDIGPAANNPVAMMFVVGFNLIIPGLLVIGSAVTLLANGGLYTQLSRLERGPRLRPE